MSYRKTYDLSVQTGSYFDQSGNEKKRWQQVGCIMEDGEGKKMILVNRTFNPAGVPYRDGKVSDTVVLSMFEPKSAGGGGYGGEASQSPQQVKDRINKSKPAQDDDDLPF